MNLQAWNFQAGGELPSADPGRLDLSIRTELFAGEL